MLKIIGYVGAGLLILVLIGGVGWKIVQKAEGYKADTQNFYSVDYHPLVGGCLRYDALKMPEKPKPEPKPIKKEAKGAK